MEDLYFEDELKNIKKRMVIKRLENYVSNWRNLFNNDFISATTEFVYQEFEDILYEYLLRKYKEEDVIDIIETFNNGLTDRYMQERYKDYEFSQEELDYIFYVELTKKWRGYHKFEICGEHAIVDILLRKVIIEEFGEDSIEIFLDIIKNKLPHTNQYLQTINHYTQLFSNNPYEENLGKKLEEAIDKSATYFFNQQINCGGYALKIDQCVYPTYQGNIEVSVSSILEKFPFVRILGNTKLEKDEYLVIYRAPEGKNTGHHFIRVDTDGTVREKDGNGEPRIFCGWPDNLKDANEVLFAVKKQHKMFGYDHTEVNENTGLDFETSFEEAFRHKQNSFSYHNQIFFLKKTHQGEIVIISEDGEIVADALAEGEEFAIEVRDEKKRNVENLTSDTKPIISNGKLVNIERFRINDNVKNVENEK